jgi:hypothetical protein
LLALLAHCHEKTCEYFCYLLLDFACADPDLQPDSLTFALGLAQQLGMLNTFEPLLRKELKKKKAEVEKLMPPAIESTHHV